MVVTCQLAEQLCQTGIVCASTTETHGENGIDSNIIVIVVAVSRQCVVDLHLRVAGADQAHGKRDSLSDVARPIVHQVAELSQDHILTDFLAHSNERQSQNSIRLDKFITLVLFLLLDEFIADVKKLLELQHCTSSRPCADGGKDGCRLSHWVVDGLENIKDHINFFLATKVQKCQSKCHEAGPLVLEVLLPLLIHQSCSNRLADLVVRGTHENQA